MNESGNEKKRRKRRDKEKAIESADKQTISVSALHVHVF